MMLSALRTVHSVQLPKMSRPIWYYHRFPDWARRCPHGSSRARLRQCRRSSEAVRYLPRRLCPRFLDRCDHFSWFLLLLLLSSSSSLLLCFAPSWKNEVCYCNSLFQLKLAQNLFAVLVGWTLLYDPQPRGIRRLADSIPIRRQSQRRVDHHESAIVAQQARSSLHQRWNRCGLKEYHISGNEQIESRVLRRNRGEGAHSDSNASFVLLRAPTEWIHST